MRFVALLALAALSGCLAPQPAASGDEGVFLFLDVARDFRAQAREGQAGVCGFASPPEIDEANRTVTFHGEGPGRAMRVLLLTVTWDRTDCAVALTSFVTSASLSGFFDRTEPAGPQLELRDGALFVDNRLLPAGESTRLHDNGTLADGRAYTLATTIRNRGDWPLAGIVQV